MAQKILQFQTQWGPATPTTSDTSSSSDTTSSAATTAAMAQALSQLQALGPDQQAMLRKLLTLTDAQTATLPKPQQELVRFARRYDRLMKLSPEDLSRLPPPQRELLLKMRGK